MNLALWILGGLLASTYLLWVHYVAVMRLLMVLKDGNLTKTATVFGYLAVAVGLVLDVVFHVIVGSILFWELPREYTLSARLTRLSKMGYGWRARWALAIRTALLDFIDSKGVHTG